MRKAWQADSDRSANVPQVVTCGSDKLENHPQRLPSLPRVGESSWGF